MALRVIKTTYRGRQGFSVVGRNSRRDPPGCSVHVFLLTREGAEAVRNMLNRGLSRKEEMSEMSVLFAEDAARFARLLLELKKDEGE